jgi:hypothetical protein
MCISFVHAHGMASHGMIFAHKVPVKIMKWEVSLEVGSMAYSTNSYLKMSDIYVFLDLKWVISST